MSNPSPSNPNPGATVSILIEVPEVVYEAIKAYTESHPDWDQDRVVTQAVALFLLQTFDDSIRRNPERYRATARVYLDSLFNRSMTDADGA